jgi:ribose transport system ATP-binding protein
MLDVPTESAIGEVLLEARHVSKSFPGVRALDDVQITVRRGRLNAVLGENGAGKSTLMNILAGVFPPDAGEILLEGQRQVFQNPREAQQAGVAIIHQELNLLPELSVAENVFLGREPRTRLGLIDYAAMHRETAALLAQLDLAIDPRTPVRRLRLGAQQIVEIAKALSLNARVLIMDEPTSAITDHEVDALFRLIRQLKSRGVGIIYITHKLDELPHIADDVTVLRDGRFIAAEPYGKSTHDELIRLMVGRDLSELFPKADASIGDEVLRLDSVSLRRSPQPDDFAVRQASLSVRRGEIVGLFGLMGAGRTELLQCIFGLHPRLSSGAIWIDGKQCHIHLPRQAIAAGLGFAPEDRKADGLVLPMTVAENISLAPRAGGGRFGLIDRRRERDLASHFAKRLGIKTPTVDQPVRYLSGGNQQKVVLSKWLATGPKVLLLDEPTRGIDINAKREIYSLINEFARAGLGVLIASSELPEILAIADRIVVLAEGRVTGEFSRHEASEEVLLKAALPAGRLDRLRTA